MRSAKERGVCYGNNTSIVRLSSSLKVFLIEISHNNLHGIRVKNIFISELVYII